MFSDTENQKITTSWRILCYQDICTYKHIEILGYNRGKHSQGIITQLRNGGN